MTRLLRATAALGLVAVVCARAPGHAQARPQTPPPQGQTPTFRTGINFVRVDVIVTDKDGNPVDDLTPEDFEIVEQGQLQTIETFKLVSLDGGLMPGPDGPPREIRTDADEELEAARDDVRLFAIFLDDYHVRRESSLVAREQLARFVETQLGPSDMVGIMYPLESTAAVRMTRNHDAIVGSLREFVGRKYDYTPTNPIEERYAYYPTQTVENIRNDVSLSALKGLITHLGGLKEGRKALILVSEGYSGLLPPQMRNQSAMVPGFGNPAQDDPFYGVNNPAEDRAAFSSNVSLEQDLREVYGLANRNNTAIYAVDPRGLATGEFGIEQNIGTRTDRQYLSSSLETLRTLSLETDGQAIVNRNDLTLAMKQIVKDSSAYYLLGYNSTLSATDGKFHEIKVRLKRPGLQLRARKGYWAFTQQDAAKALAPPAPEVPKAYTSALAAIASPSRSRLVRTWIGNARGPDGKTRVTFLWEPVAPAPGDRAREAEVPARVSLIAAGADGSPYFRGTVPGSGSSPPAAAAAAPAGSAISFDVPPGTLELRVAVESADDEVLDSEVREIEVPDLTGAALTFATPELFRARTMRDYQRLKADPKATPTAAREFSRTERVFLRFAVYSSGGASPELSARLLNRSGEPIATLTIAPSPLGPELRDVDIPVTSVPPGEYLVEITAPSGAQPVQEVVGLRIVS
jgi:VWFA-related protein